MYIYCEHYCVVPSASCSIVCVCRLLRLMMGEFNLTYFGMKFDMPICGRGQSRGQLLKVKPVCSEPCPSVLPADLSINTLKGEFTNFWPVRCGCPPGRGVQSYKS